MTNSKWNKLSEMEKKKFIAELCHTMGDDLYFDKACKMVNQAKRAGLFEGVIMLPNELKIEINNR
jgi:hypothetical protein